MLRYASGRLPAVRADAVQLPVRDGCLPAAITVMAHTDMPLTRRCWPKPPGSWPRAGGSYTSACNPCFGGGFADRSDPAAVVIRPGYLDGHWTKASWTTRVSGTRSAPPTCP